LDDVTAVVVLERGVAAAPHWGEGEYVAMVRGGAEEFVRRCLLVAERGGELVGFAVGKVIAGGVGELESVVVGEAIQREGVGRALCEAVIGWCKREGVVAVELEVRSANLGAVGLYEGLGFERVGSRKGYYREPVDDAILMRLKLAGH
jgi:ribosomal-protein-alanine N-acetyltransferase